MYKERLSARERLILNTICGADHPLITRDIIGKNEKLSQSTVQLVVRELSDRGLIKESGVKHSGNVLAREYIATEKASEEVLLYVVEEYQQIRNVISITEYIMALIEAEKDDNRRKQLVEEVRELIQELKSKET